MFSNTECGTTESIDEFVKIANPYQFKTENDLLSRPVQQKTVNRNRQTILTKTLYYKKNGSLATKLLEREEIRVKNALYKSNTIVFNDQNKLSKHGNRSFTYGKAGNLLTDSKDNTSLEYDYFGNITKRTTGGIEYSYTYLSDDRLSKVSSVSSMIEYSYSSDNPLYPNSISRSINGVNTVIALNYQGKRLVSTNVNGNNYQYYYDENGHRLGKVLPNNEKLTYFYSSSGELEGIWSSNGYSLMYTYSENGLPVMVTYSTKTEEQTYFYVLDTMGNIKALTDDLGNIVIEYDYDTFGKPKILKDISTIALTTLDPLRFKGYVYDSETELYYLLSRYYDPSVGRFLTPDNVTYLSPETGNGLNPYAYCKNDFINNSDPTGNFVIMYAMLIAFAIGAGVEALSSVASQFIENGFSFKNFSWGQFALDTIMGGLNGAMSVSPLGRLGMIVAGAVVGAFSGLFSCMINGETDPSVIFQQVLISAGVGALGASLGGAGLFGPTSEVGIDILIDKGFFKVVSKEFSELITKQILKGTLISMSFSTLLIVSKSINEISNIIKKKILRSLI